jgi:hypothetical protein
MKRVFRAALASVMLALAAASPAAAGQAITTASITGRVIDPSGAAIPGATIAIRSVDRNQRQQVTSSSRGQYQLLSLEVGAYELEVSAPGFATRTLTITLAVGQALDVPVALAVAGISAEIDVTGAPIVETRRTAIADVITPREIDELPLNGRNYLDLALLTPAVSRTVLRNTERFAETSAVPGTGISVAGQRNLNNAFLVDGVSANDDGANLAGTYFAEDVIREFQVVTSGGSAEFGRASAGIVNVVTRSGSNARHGRAYGFFREDSLDARNPLAAGKDPLQHAQFGLTFSGPVVRDRTFWFGNVERTDLDRTGTITIAPANVAAVNQVLDAVSYSGPRIGGGEFPTGYATLNVFARVDHSAADSPSRVAVRYSLYDVGSENARSVGGLSAVTRGTRLDDRDQTIAVNWVRVGGGASVNELRGQATRSRLGADPNDLAGPAINIAGVANFGTSTTSPTGRDLDVFELSDSFAWQRGSHLLKTGALLLYERLNVEFPGALQGVYAFSSLANFRAGRFTNFQQAFGEANQFQENPNLGLFVQDEWRPRAGLTINGGLRYDLQWIDDLVETDTNNVSPRLGVAFAPGAGRTVIRASGGLYFDRIPLRAVSNALQRDGLKYRVALLQFGQSGAPMFPAVLSGFPAGILTNVTTIRPDIQSGVARQAGVQIERQVSRAISASAGYLHLTGRQIIMSRNVNVPTLTAAQAEIAGDRNLGRPDSRFGNNGQFQSIGRSRYDALTLSINFSRSRAAMLRASYTLSKSLDDAGNAFFSSPQDNFNVAGDWGRSDNDQRHRFVLSGTTPKLAGVQFAYLFGYASAPPFNIQTGTDRNNDTNANDRPEGVARNTGEGFDSATLDLRASRMFTIAGSHRVEVILDAFNVLNRSNFLIPNNTFGPGLVPPASFGQATAAADPRQLQVGVRWSF